MKHNLQPHIDADIEAVIEEFLKIGWSKRDTHYLVKKIGNIAMGLVFYAEILSYQGRKTKNRISVVWIACRHNYSSQTETVFRAEIIEKELEQLSIRPFKDEDAFKSKFKKRNASSYYALTCYFNPDYPKGWWSNHALG